MVDWHTGRAIDKAMHARAGESEQIGELRNEIVHILNALGIEPPAGFARFNEIAVAEIEKGQAKKAVL